MSVRLKSRTQCPVNGFQFFQAETGFDLVKACPTCQWDFKGAVQVIIAHRRSNPRFNLPTDIIQVSDELDLTNAMRMLAIKGGDYYISTDAAPFEISPKFKALRSQRPVAAGGGVLPKMISGAAVLDEFLGAGGVAIPPEQAWARAITCATCEHNGQGDWTSYFTKPASEMVRKWLGIKHDLGLTTPEDEKLNVCEICLCPLKLKVHVPMPAIKAHLHPSTLEDLKANAPWCWMLKDS